jgi:hypothetical protein
MQAFFTDHPPPTDLALELLERWCWWPTFHAANVPLFAQSGKPRGVVAIGARRAYILSATINKPCAEC